MERKTPIFTYGDTIRHKIAGPPKLIRDITDTTYEFMDGSFSLIEDQDCYELVEGSSGFFRVATGLDDLSLADYVEHGYESLYDYRTALLRILDKWGGRTGEIADSRHDHLQLKFLDTPGGRPDRAWLPRFLLTPTEKPDYVETDERSSGEKELDRIFGFDDWNRAQRKSRYPHGRRP